MINFTVEHKARLENLFLKLSFLGITLPGKFNANSFTPWELLNITQITTLQGLYTQLKKEVSSFDEVDSWSTTPQQSQKISILKDWSEFINLLIGYKKYQFENEQLAKAERQKTIERLKILEKAKNIAELREVEKLSLEEINKRIEELS